MNVVKWHKDYIVFLRFFCVVGLVIHHAALALPITFHSHVDDFWCVCNMIGRMTRFMVPVFLMITGCLLLDKNKKIPLTKALNKYVKRMVIVICSVGLVFAFLQNVFIDSDISIKIFLDSVLDVYQGRTWKHFWYLYMLIGLYCVIPMIKSYINVANKKEILAFTMLLFLFVSVLPFFSVVFNVSCGVIFPIMSEYLLYLLVGFLLASDEVYVYLKNKIGVLFLMLLFVYCMIFLGSYLQYYHSYYLFEQMFSYSSPLTVVMSMLVFLIPKIYIEKNNISINNFFVCKIADLSFGIYVFHMLWIHIFYKVVKFNPLENYNYILFLGVCILVLLLSAVTTVLFRMFPVVGRYI